MAQIVVDHGGRRIFGLLSKELSLNYRSRDIWLTVFGNRVMSFRAPIQQPRSMQHRLWATCSELKPGHPEF